MNRLALKGWFGGVLACCRVLNSELRQFGEVCTQRLVLEAWDRLFGSG